MRYLSPLNQGSEKRSVKSPSRQPPSPLYCRPSTPKLTSGKRDRRVNSAAASACLISCSMTLSFGSLASASASSLAEKGMAGAAGGNRNGGQEESAARFKRRFRLK